MTFRTRIVALGGVALFAIGGVAVLGQLRRLDRESLIADTRQLADMIERVHPDPYVNGGGKVAFHRRVQAALAAIPADGMSRNEFYRLLLPVVTGIRDAHTWLRSPYAYNDDAPGGIPLYFGVVDSNLYVVAVPEERYRPLIGALLVSVEGVLYRDLVNRLWTMVSGENEYQLLRNLAYAGILWERSFLTDLLPEWRDQSQVRLTLQHRDGRIVEHTIPIPSELPGPFISPGSRIERPSPGPAGFGYAFLDSARTTALLVVDQMGSYREAFEMWHGLAPADAESEAREVYERVHETRAPDGFDAVIAGLPSATELFRSLVQEMKDAGTRTLLVDVRRNDGGNSAMSAILLYFLYGREVLLRAQFHRTEVRRYSEDYFATHAVEPFERANREQAVPLRRTDYDFSADWYGRLQEDPGAVPQLTAEYEQEVDQMPTFAAEYRSGEYERYYLPEHVMVLSSPRTFSSGYTLMYYLYRAGATIVGTPSAQAGNCFGETLTFELERSGLTGTVSQKRVDYFHNDPEAGRVLRPHHPLTYEALKRYDFDLNAEILLALDIVGR
jgi:hypothetical protein